MAQTIKSLIAPLIMMAVLALLPACWGLKRPSPVTSTIELCTTNPFQESCDETYEIERIVKINECIAGGAAATATCADAVAANSCIRDPFAVACEANPTFAAYIARARNARVTYCQLPTADSTLCAGVAGSTLLDTECLDSPLEAPAYSSCSTRPSVVRICADDPFTRTGCGNVSTIEALRIAHCEDSATAWDDDCVEATYTGATVARNTACLTHGINADAGGHADCAMRGNVLLACSETTPFAYDVCDAVEGIGMKQMAACLADVDADDGCVALIMQTCEDTPLAGVSCAGLEGYTEDLNMFCSTGNNAMLGGCATTPARLSACAAGTLGINECDTDAIASAVCASSGANANPFVAFCSTASNIGGNDMIADIRQAVVTLCLDGANASMAVCQNTDTVVSALTTGGTRCILDTNAFTDRCAYTQYDSAREGFCPESDPFAYTGCNNVGIINTRRATYCNMPINAWKANCTGGSFGGTHDSTTAEGKACVLYGMGANGDSSCNSNTYADSFCKMQSTNPLDTTDNMGCRVLDDFAMISKAYCVADPFTTVGCDGLNNFADIVGDYCDMNADQATCKVDSTAWTGSFTGGGVLATAPATGDTANRFLSGLTGATDVPDTDFTPLTTTARDGHTANATHHLALNDTEHGFGGQADDGVMFFGGQLNDNSYRYYAGIYMSTNLGAPLTDVSQNGVWQAWMRTSGKDPKNEAFELTVDFDATTATGTLKAFFQSTGGGLYYNIDGAFKINGVITGNVAIGTAPTGTFVESGNDYTSGVLTGLIGAQGVVAAFFSNTSTITADDGNGINPFVGGFVGVPLAVTYADWNVVASPDAALDNPIANQFLAGASSETDAVSVNLKDATYNSNPLNGDDMDGFAYNTAGTTPDFVYYVGLLPSTDLGLPLDMTTAMGTWNGSFISIEGETAATPADFTLTVTYGGSGLSAGKSGSVAATIANTLYSFTGEFDARGVIIGTVTRTETSPVSTSMGTLQGLIGQDGAVGVFISNAGEGVDYGGGFVARKQP